MGMEFVEIAVDVFIRYVKLARSMTVLASVTVSATALCAAVFAAAFLSAAVLSRAAGAVGRKVNGRRNRLQEPGGDGRVEDRVCCC